MALKRFIEPTGVIAVFAAIVLTGTFINSQRVHADDKDSEESKIQQGFAIAPVPLNLEGKNRALVGLGSYIVNGQGDCNGCHQGLGPTYLPGGNPFNGEHPTKINPAVYLAGGLNFGPVGPPPTPNIYPRNLTPDKTGLPEGGHTFEEFLTIMRTGKDFDHLHPNCTATITTNCIPAATGLKGDLLQIMPWPAFGQMTDHDLLAVWTYLSAIPCISNAGLPVPPHIVNACN